MQYPDTAGHCWQAPVDSSEEDSDEQNSYDYNDKFLAGDDEEEEEEGENEGNEEERRRKKQKRRRDFELEEEDYQLLEDNEVKAGPMSKLPAGCQVTTCCNKPAAVV